MSGGGTGGHIYPAIAVADELKMRYPNARFLFVGANGKMEMQKVPKAGYEIVGLPIAGIKRSLSVSNLIVPFKLIKSLIKARKIIKNFNPDVVIGTGGYASAPVLRAASNKGIACLIQEQNSYAGVTNKLLAKKVSKICVAYQGMEQFFPKEKIVFTGNPVRQDLLNVGKNRQDGIKHFDLNPNKKTLLVLGGSLGARRINQLIEKELDFILNQDVQIIWQCGKFYYEEYKKYNSDTQHPAPSTQVLPFIDRMDLAYAAADLVISRAGALSVSELCLVEKPVIFIPSPNVAENHQKKNALSLVKENAAVMIEEKELDLHFENEFTALALSDEKQKNLKTNISRLAKPFAAKNIVDEIEKLLTTNSTKNN